MKMIPLNKQSKKVQREYYLKQRGSWNGVKPVTRIIKSKKVYDRKRVDHLSSHYYADKV